MKKVDIILPMHRSKPGWAHTIAEYAVPLKEALNKVGAELTLCIVNDGGDVDAYGKENFDFLTQKVGAFQFVTYRENNGKGYALRYAVRHCTGDFQIYTDHDFPFGIDSIVEAYLLLADGADIVLGKRTRAYAEALPKFRRFISTLQCSINSMVLGLPSFCSDTQGGLKGFGPEGKAAFLQTKINHFLFDTEFIVIGNVRELKIASITLIVRDGLVFSVMGMKVMTREFKNLILLITRYRWRMFLKQKAVEFKK